MLTIPEGVVDCDSDPLAALPVDMLAGAEAVAYASIDSDSIIGEYAAAKPMRAGTMVDLEKYILIVALLFVPDIVLKYYECRRREREWI